jgi:hypothetical protein
MRFDERELADQAAHAWLSAVRRVEQERPLARRRNRRVGEPPGRDDGELKLRVDHMIILTHAAKVAQHGPCAFQQPVSRITRRAR